MQVNEVFFLSTPIYKIYYFTKVIYVTFTLIIDLVKTVARNL